MKFNLKRVTAALLAGVIAVSCVSVTPLAAAAAGLVFDHIAFSAEIAGADAPRSEINDTDKPLVLWRGGGKVNVNPTTGTTTTVTLNALQVLAHEVYSDGVTPDAPIYYSINSSANYIWRLATGPDAANVLYTNAKKPVTAAKGYGSTAATLPGVSVSAAGKVTVAATAKVPETGFYVHLYKKVKEGKTTVQVFQAAFKVVAQQAATKIAFTTASDGKLKTTAKTIPINNPTPLFVTNFVSGSGTAKSPYTSDAAIPAYNTYRISAKEAQKVQFRIEDQTGWAESLRGITQEQLPKLQVQGLDLTRTAILAVNKSAAYKAKLSAVTALATPGQLGYGNSNSDGYQTYLKAVVTKRASTPDAAGIANVTLTSEQSGKSASIKLTTSNPVVALSDGAPSIHFEVTNTVPSAQSIYLPEYVYTAARPIAYTSDGVLQSAYITTTYTGTVTVLTAKKGVAPGDIKLSATGAPTLAAANSYAEIKGTLNGDKTKLTISITKTGASKSGEYKIYVIYGTKSTELADYKILAIPVDVTYTPTLNDKVQNNPYPKLGYFTPTVTAKNTGISEVTITLSGQVPFSAIRTTEAKNYFELTDNSLVKADEYVPFVAVSLAGVVSSATKTVSTFDAYTEVYGPKFWARSGNNKDNKSVTKTNLSYGADANLDILLTEGADKVSKIVVTTAKGTTTYIIKNELTFPEETVYTITANNSPTGYFTPTVNAVKTSDNSVTITLTGTAPATKQSTQAVGLDFGLRNPNGPDNTGTAVATGGTVAGGTVKFVGVSLTGLYEYAAKTIASLEAWDDVYNAAFWNVHNPNQSFVKTTKKVIKGTTTSLWDETITANPVPYGANETTEIILTEGKGGTITVIYSDGANPQKLPVTYTIINNIGWANSAKYGGHDTTGWQTITGAASGTPSDYVNATQINITAVSAAKGTARAGGIVKVVIAQQLSMENSRAVVILSDGSSSVWSDGALVKSVAGSEIILKLHTSTSYTAKDIEDLLKNAEVTRDDNGKPTTVPDTRFKVDLRTENASEEKEIRLAFDSIDNPPLYFTLYTPPA